MDIVGKTVAWVEKKSNDIWADGDVWIHFTDGTTISLVATGYEADGVELEEISPERILKIRRKEQGRREEKRMARLREMEWLSISCEERVARLEARREKMSPFTLMMTESIRKEYQALMNLANRQMFGDRGGWVTKRCPKCHELKCENAVRKYIEPTDAAASMGVHGGFIVKVEPGSNIRYPL